MHLGSPSKKILVLYFLEVKAVSSYPLASKVNRCADETSISSIKKGHNLLHSKASLLVIRDAQNHEQNLNYIGPTNEQKKKYFSFPQRFFSSSKKIL